MRRHAFLFRPWVCRFILTAAVAAGLATLAPPVSVLGVGTWRRPLSFQANDYSG